MSVLVVFSFNRYLLVPYFNTTLVSVLVKSFFLSFLFYGFQYNACVGSSHAKAGIPCRAEYFNTTLVSVLAIIHNKFETLLKNFNTTLVSVLV